MATIKLTDGYCGMILNDHADAGPLISALATEDQSLAYLGWREGKPMLVFPTAASPAALAALDDLDAVRISDARSRMRASAVQIRKALNAAGLRTALDSYLADKATISDDRDYFEYETALARTHPFWERFGVHAGIKASDLDALFASIPLSTP